MREQQADLHYDFPFLLLVSGPGPGHLSEVKQNEYVRRGTSSNCLQLGAIGKVGEGERDKLATDTEVGDRREFSHVVKIELPDKDYNIATIPHKQRKQSRK